MTDEPTTPTPDVDELRERVAELEAATAALREYGDRYDLPAIERNAARIEGTVRIVRQNVPDRPTDADRRD